MYRLEPFSSSQVYPATVGKYDGATGARVGTFVSSNISGILTPANMRFGPNGNLFVDNGNEILQFNGMTGAPMGAISLERAELATYLMPFSRQTAI